MCTALGSRSRRAAVVGRRFVWRPKKDEFWTFSVDSDWLRPVEHAAAGIVAPGDEEVPQINGDE